MTGEAETTLHPDDADLLRWVDGALPPAERAVLEEHVSGCDPCRVRQARIVRRVSRLSEVLRETDLPVPAPALRTRVSRARGRASAGWKVAAVVVLLIGASTAVTPVRAWFVAMAKTAWARIKPGATGVIESASGSVSFMPGNGTLVVRVPERAGASLTIEVVDGDRVTAAGGNAGGVTVLPNEVRFAPDGKPVADYAVSVPLRVGTVRVVVGEKTARVLRPATVGERWSVPLTP